jgi:SAM-dependent methyltransferase
LRAIPLGPLISFMLAALLGAALALAGATPWRRAFVAIGFPLSLAATDLGALPAWAWLAPLAALAFVYPMRSWRDAPLFPTPKGALRGLAAQVALPVEGRFLDAGCGLGDALIELHREFPRASLSGIEWSGLLRLACALRCRFASVRRADMWAADWSGFDLVYVFQRPESMERVIAKASRELRPGAWLASLEFEVDSRRPSWVFVCADGRPLWLYRMAPGR